MMLWYITMSSIPTLNVSGLTQLNAAMSNLEAEAQRLMVGTKRGREMLGGALMAPEQLAQELKSFKNCLISLKEYQSPPLAGGRKTRRRRGKKGGQDASECGNIVGNAAKMEKDLSAMVQMANSTIEAASMLIKSAEGAVSSSQQGGAIENAPSNLDEAMAEARAMQQQAQNRMSAAQEIQRAADALQQALAAQRAILTPRAVVAMEESIQAARQSAHAQLTDGDSCNLMQIALGLLLVTGGGAAAWQALNAAGQGNALGMLLGSVVSGVQSFVGGILTGLTAAINARNQTIITALREQMTYLMAFAAADAGAADAIGRAPGDSRFLSMRMARGIAYRICSKMPKQSGLRSIAGRMGSAVTGMFRRPQPPTGASVNPSTQRQMTLRESLDARESRQVRSRTPAAPRGGAQKKWRMRKTARKLKGKKRTFKKRVSKMRNMKRSRSRR